MFLLKFCLMIFVLVGAKVNCDHVPVVLWNIKGSSLPLKSVSSFEANDKSMQDLLDSSLKDESTTVLLYVGDRLSMEDLTPDREGKSNSLKTLKSLLEDAFPVMYPSVKEPVRHFRESTCGVKDIHAAKHGENLDKVISNAVENSCIVIVHLGSKGLVEGKTPTFKNSKKNIIGVFTASKSSWHPFEESHRRSRSLFGNDETSNFIDINGCIILYADFVNITFGSSTENDTVSLPFPPSNFNGNCDNATSSVTLTFAKSESKPEVILTLNYERRHTLGSWIMKASTISIKDRKGFPDDEIALKIPKVDVPMSFSYSCGDFIMKPNDTALSAKIVIDRFQIQPFGVEGKFFSRSFDCVPFFTLPIWMGIFVAFLFIAILNVGVYALFNIKTMDRFDDPKGKTIAVPVGND